MAFRSFISEFQNSPQSYPTADRAFVGLLDSIVERLADILEKVGFESETLSADLFKRELEQKTKPERKAAKKPVKIRNLLHRVGNIGNLDAKVRESLVSLQRLLSFLNETRVGRFGPESKILLQANRNDLQSLGEHSHFLADKITFLLDATLGLINIEQNDIIRMFSIAAVIFMPPTLIASLYGMNFREIPELTWKYGYEYALLLMALSSLLPFLFFKRRGWL